MLVFMVSVLSSRVVEHFCQDSCGLKRLVLLCRSSQNRNTPGCLFFCRLFRCPCSVPVFCVSILTVVIRAPETWENDCGGRRRVTGCGDKCAVSLTASGHKWIQLDGRLCARTSCLSQFSFRGSFGLIIHFGINSSTHCFIFRLSAPASVFHKFISSLWE